MTLTEPGPEPGTTYPAAAPGARAVPPKAVPPKADELLDRVSLFYRAHTAALLWLAAIPATLYLCGSVVHRLLARWAAGHVRAALATQAGLVLLLLAGYALSHAATALYANNTDTAWRALRQAWPRTLRYFGIALWQTGSLAWLPAALGLLALSAFHVGRRAPGEALLAASAAGCVYGVIAWLRNSLALPAAAVESLPVRAAMRRSKVLGSGRTRHLLKTLASLVLLSFVGYFAEEFCRLFLAQARAPVQQAVGLALGFAVRFVLVLLLSPLWSLMFSLLYFDERDRGRR